MKAVLITAALTLAAAAAVTIIITITMGFPGATPTPRPLTPNLPTTPSRSEHLKQNEKACLACNRRCKELGALFDPSWSDNVTGKCFQVVCGPVCGPLSADFPTQDSWAPDFDKCAKIFKCTSPDVPCHVKPSTESSTPRPGPSPVCPSPKPCPACPEPEPVLCPAQKECEECAECPEADDTMICPAPSPCPKVQKCPRPKPSVCECHCG
ncbi:hypothetical protein IF1G_01171 [Cordyceps javanica]|uniref:Uncharacterized protein n=1 Tax=Cordyceps javanica TaxID=43265 RepID=A0A545VHW8_9HYPO|nr:hypothetical protein IF1G_01171 [Cordyceps javanica]TQW12391.1 hypothetical protein IF2G_01122 [Cordyceps javanica]